MKMKCAIFDMDGTLIDSLGWWNLFWRELAEKYENPDFFPTDEEDSIVRTMLLSESMEYIFKRYDFISDLEELLLFAKKSAHRYYAETVTLKKGVLEYLEYLKSNGVKMAVASASDKEMVVFVAKRLGISKYFDLIISCSEVGIGKSSPKVFLEAARRLGAEAPESFVFEDSLKAIKTARTAGFKTVGIYDKNNYGHEEMKALVDFYIDEGETLEKLIKE